MSDFSFLANAHPAYIEKMYTSFLNNPDSVEESWRTFFRGFDYAHANNGHTKATTGTATLNPKEFQVLSLIKAYRNRGHLMSTPNPIRKRRDR
ncbi:MAG: 2-oxoglutarate dehydrogenase E1 component, partial [Saprospiraceae bacterium]|nr:2-oxoglutarate dehydrogenase E1 component [Saprospiraceae bacterium]